MQESITLQLAKDLIACPSITPLEAGCFALLKNVLTPLGFACESLPFAEVNNLWCTYGSTGPLFVFAGHVDVVPTGPLEAWHSHPFIPTIRDGHLFGRGAADMKGSLAAMISATTQFIQSHKNFPGRIGFLLTSDEEGPGINGTKKVMEYLQAKNVIIDYCIVGEPTCVERLGDMLKIGRRGSYHGFLKIMGKQGHVAYPDLASNPIHLSLQALHKLTQIVWDNATQDFQASTFQISNIKAGTGATNVIPGYLECAFNLRYSTALTVPSIQQKITAILDKYALNYTIEWNLSGEPFLTKTCKLLEVTKSVISEITHITPRCTTDGGTSDARFIAPYGVDVLEFGPINKTIHSINECINIEDVEKLTLIYLNILKKLLQP